MLDEKPMYWKWMLGRRSVRSFRPDAIPEDALQRILEAACSAPSAHNSQPWRFVIFPVSKDRERLAELFASQMRREMGSGGDGDAILQRAQRTRQRFLGAPLALLVCCEFPDSDPESENSKKAERMLAIQSVASAVSYLLLAAHSEGLGACWIGYPAFCPPILFHEFGLSDRWEPQAAVLIGYPAEQPQMPERIPLDKIKMIVGETEKK